MNTNSSFSKCTRKLCAGALLVGASLLVGCQGAGGATTVEGGLIFGGQEYGGRVHVKWSRATVLPHGAVPIGELNVHGTAVQLYLDPSTGRLYVIDPDGDVHEVWLDGLREDVRAQIERLRREYERQKNKEAKDRPQLPRPGAPGLTDPTAVVLIEPLPPSPEDLVPEPPLDMSRFPVAEPIDGLGEGSELAFGLAPVSMDATIDFAYDLNQDRAMLGITAPLRTGWHLQPEFDTSWLAVDVDVVEHEDSVTLTADGTINSVLAVLMMAGVESLEGEIELGWTTADASIKLYPDASMAVVEIEGRGKRVYLIYEE